MERRTIKIMDDIIVDEQKYEGDNNENETDKITGELHILAVDPWTQTSILADIGTFALPFLTYILIESYIEEVTITHSDKDTVLCIGHN